MAASTRNAKRTENPPRRCQIWSITTELAVELAEARQRRVSGFVEGSHLIMFQTASHLLHRVTDRRCPSCGCVEVRRSARKNSFEAVVLPFLLTRPFRCENCGNRFYGLAFRRRAPGPDDAKPMSDLPQDYPVLVYGRVEDEEPFQEETNVRALNLRGGLITLATRVEPGQHLVLINPATEEDQPCRVAFVGEQYLGRNIIGIQFCRFAREFWYIDRPTHRKSNATTAEPFWEQ